jgi:hypothetical protein
VGGFDPIGRPRESLLPTRGGQAPEEYKRSGGTVNRNSACLSAALSFAIQERRLTDRNPVSNTSRKRESRCRTRFLSDEKRAALLDVCEKSAWTPPRTLLLLAITTGARNAKVLDDRGQGALTD